jgi:hypothetical protein
MIAIDPYDMEWYTPPEILNSVYEVLSTITLDPCSPVIPTVEAQTYYTVEDNGLVLPWFGNVFMNPPYGRDIPQWVNKFIKEWTIVSEGGGEKHPECRTVSSC